MYDSKPVIIIAVTAGVIVLIVIAMFVMPIYSVWSQELQGKAELKRAEWNRQITIKEAEAKKESAKSLAEAEVIRSKGIAEANKIISESITANYLKYKFIDEMKDANTQVIYVPTEANLPVLESTRNLSGRN